MADTKSMKTTMHMYTTLYKDENGKVDRTNYQGMIDPLFYLIANKPNIVDSVYFYARFRSNPKESQSNVVKMNFWYLISTNLSM